MCVHAGTEPLESEKPVKSMLCGELYHNRTPLIPAEHGHTGSAMEPLMHRVCDMNVVNYQVLIKR